jgi:AraC-like DNA-binding protein
MMAHASEAMSGHLRAPLPASAQEPHTFDGLGAVVQEIVTALLPDGCPDVRSVAKVMRLSSRTLQRRLSAEGVTFACLVAQVRYAIAQRMLDDPGHKIIEVALDLGYSDQAHFARAFVRWSGLTPRQFRRLRSMKRSGRVPPGGRLTSDRDAAIRGRPGSLSPTRLHLVAGAPQPERASEEQGGFV